MYSDWGCFTRPPYCEESLGLYRRGLIIVFESWSWSTWSWSFQLNQKLLCFCQNSKYVPNSVTIQTLNQKEPYQNLKPSKIASVQPALGVEDFCRAIRVCVGNKIMCGGTSDAALDTYATIVCFKFKNMVAKCKHCLLLLTRTLSQTPSQSNPTLILLSIHQHENNSLQSKSWILTWILSKSLQIQNQKGRLHNITQLGTSLCSLHHNISQM